ncbi:CAP domain-containing protein [Sulfitobacter sp. LCG007]
MFRLLPIISLLALSIAACTPVSQSSGVGPDGLPLPKIYRINRMQSGQIQVRMLDAVNSLRVAAGVPAVELDSTLNAIANAHSRDMSQMNRPWNWGSDLLDPWTRARRAGYQGDIYEAISESYETELETLAGWMEDSRTRPIVLEPSARYMGFGWHQDSSGKIWWTLEMGS